MALLAESIVDEWLNRNRFFTIRGIRHGQGEIDLLGVRSEENSMEAWHVEVQASFRPLGYIAPLTESSLSGFAKSRTSMKTRTAEILEPAIAAWVNKKFTSPQKRDVREKAWPGLQWKYVLVHAVVKEPEELLLIQSHGVKVIPLHQILGELGHSAATGIRGGAATDLSEIIEYACSNVNIGPEQAVAGVLGRSDTLD